MKTGRGSGRGGGAATGHAGRGGAGRGGGQACAKHEVSKKKNKKRKKGKLGGSNGVSILQERIAAELARRQCQGESGGAALPAVASGAARRAVASPKVTYFTGLTQNSQVDPAV
jgi:hypothetical protein